MAPVSTLAYPLFPTMRKSLAPSACYFFQHLGHYNSLGGGREIHPELQRFCQKAQDTEQPSGKPMPQHFADDSIAERNACFILYSYQGREQAI